MNAIDAGRNELARLGLHPGARHPNVVDPTPVQDEDSTIFYDYWTFNNPTVIKTGETGRLLGATVYTSASDGDEQAIPIVGEAACQEYVRQAVAWESDDADRIRQDTAHAHIMAHAPIVDIDTEDLTLTLTDLNGDPIIDLHTSSIAGGGWARLHGHGLDELDNIIASPDFSRLPHRVGMRRDSLTAFLTTLSDDLDKIHYDAMHAPGVPTLSQAIKAAKRAQPTTEAAARATQRSSIPPEMLGKSAPRIGKQAVPTTPMRWVPSPTIHQAEGRSL